jgi:uncharacterized sporulation protein YeaH/YhbH (DUF444 family)
MSDTISESISDTDSIKSDDIVLSDELQNDFAEAMQQCAEIERLHAHIVTSMENIEIAEAPSDCILVTYEDESQDLMDVLDSIHKKSQESTESNLGSMLLSMLETCEFK